MFFKTALPPLPSPADTRRIVDKLARPVSFVTDSAFFRRRRPAHGSRANTSWLVGIRVYRPGWPYGFYQTRCTRRPWWKDGSGTARPRCRSRVPCRPYRTGRVLRSATTGPGRPTTTIRAADCSNTYAFTTAATVCRCPATGFVTGVEELIQSPASLLIVFSFRGARDKNPVNGVGKGWARTVNDNENAFTNVSKPCPLHGLYGFWFDGA